MDVHMCEYCDKKFSNKSNMVKHVNDVCKYVDDINIITTRELQKIKVRYSKLEGKYKKLKIDYDKLKKSNKRLLDKNMIMSNYAIEQKHNGNNNKINQLLNPSISKSMNISINATIVIQDFFSTKYVLIDSEMERCMSKGFNALLFYVKLTHCNRNKPQYNNVYTPSLKHTYSMIVCNGVFCAYDKDEVVETIYNDRNFDLNNYFEENRDRLSKHIKDSYTKVYEYDREHMHDDNDIFKKKAKKEINIILYNNVALCKETSKRSSMENVTSNRSVFS